MALFLARCVFLFVLVFAALVSVTFSAVILSLHQTKSGSQMSCHCSLCEVCCPLACQLRCNPMSQTYVCFLVSQQALCFLFVSVSALKQSFWALLSIT